MMEPNRVFIRVIGPDGRVVDAIGYTDQVVMHDVQDLPYGVRKWLLEVPTIHVMSWFMSKQDAPVQWEQRAVQEATPRNLFGDGT